MEEFVAIFYFFRIFAEDPSDSWLRLWLRVLLHFIHKVTDQLLILSREPSENVLSDDHSLLESYRLTVLNNVLDNLDRSRDRLVYFKNDLPDGLHSCLDQIHVHVIWVILELIQNSLCALLIHNFHKDLYFLKFQIQWVIESTKKHFLVAFENRCVFL